MGESFTVYVTGDGGEDLFARSEEGSRPVRHTLTHSPADTEYNFVVKRGAPFIAEVLKKLLEEPSDQPMKGIGRSTPMSRAKIFRIL